MEHFESLHSFLIFLSAYILPIVLWVIFLFACVRYFLRKKFIARESLLSFRNLIIYAIGGRIAHAGLLMYLQYSLWNEGGMGSYFLTAPLSKDLPIDGMKYFGWLFTNKFGYFLFYSWGRFWLSVIISIFVAYIFYIFLKLLKKRTERFFEEGEVELGFLSALIVGWPLFVIFVPLVFLSVIIVSLVRLIFLKQQYTTLGTPFLLAVLFLLLFGSYFIDVFNLVVLKV
ncbi:hypothetical protein C4565_07480 [Candidatus Parcubacteria bacterium]|jgi:hypothetical protein|nr:MAG: hypothetical protein C4565_07480 [Candidatus Parcubacteria bacterium]